MSHAGVEDRASEEPSPGNQHRPRVIEDRAFARDVAGQAIAEAS
jgi:hypothetical protein